MKSIILLKKVLTYMGRYGVFLSCVNSNCESETYIEVLAATNLKAAVQNANMFNSINKTSIFCPVCGEQMIYKPYDRPKENEFR